MCKNAACQHVLKHQQVATYRRIGARRQQRRHISSNRGPCITYRYCNQDSTPLPWDEIPRRFFPKHFLRGGHTQRNCRRWQNLPDNFLQTRRHIAWRSHPHRCRENRRGNSSEGECFNRFRTAVPFSWGSL